LNKAKLPQVGNQPQLMPDLIKKVNPGIASGNSQLGLNSNAIKKLNPAILPCKPICDPCKNPCNNWCGPTWWWCPSFCTPCYTGCYYPTIYTYPTPIVVEVPVATTVVMTGAAVAPAAAAEPVAERLMQIPVGATITLQGKDLGDATGQVVLQIDKLSLPAQLNEWKSDAVNLTLPMLGLAGPMKAQLWMVKSDGAVAANIPVELLPAQPPANAQPVAAAAPMAQ
jgi:hypothetical protein